MNITEISVKRPTAIIMLVVLLVGIGVWGYTSLGANLLPASNIPVITITSTYPGAGAKEIEKDVIKPIEDAVSGISGIDKIRSVAADGYGYSILQFKMSADANTSIIDVQKAMDGISDKLPKDATRPVIRKIDLNADPILMLSISGGSSYEELYDYADKLKKSFENISGVGNVTLEGALKKELTISLDKASMEYYGIAVDTVLNILQAENVNIPAGQIKEETRNRIVRVQGEFENIEKIKDLRIPSQAGIVRLGDIASVELKYPDSNKLVRLNGVDSIGINVQKQSDSNIVDTANLVKAKLEDYKKTIPKNVKIVIANDATNFITSSLNETKRNMVEGMFTTAIVLLLFLRRWRSSLIVLIAIPTSVISTFFMMYVSKFTFNIVSLLGLAMCIGILVDDSIVILENIDRHINLGKSPMIAAVDGRKEIGLAAIAITLCDVVVFAPVAFMSDMVGQFFREFGLTVVFATLFSLFVSFTLTPMLAAYLHKAPKKSVKKDKDTLLSKGAKRFSNVFDILIVQSYQKILDWSLNNRLKVVAVVVCGLIISISMLPLGFVQTEFLPSFDQGKVTVTINLTSGATLNQTNDKAKEIESYLKQQPEVKDYITTVGNGNIDSTANIIVKLKDKSQRNKTQAQMAEQIRNWGQNMTGVQFSVTQSTIIDRTSVDGAKPVVINITGPSQDVLKQIAGETEKIVKSVNGIVDVSNSLSNSQPEISVNVDKAAASDYGITSYDAASVLRCAIEGSKIGVYRNNGNEYDINVHFKSEQIKTPADIGSVKIMSSAGKLIELSQIAKITNSDSPQQISRQDRQQLVSVSANIEGKVLGGINKELKEKLKDLSLPYGYSIVFGGDQDNMTTAFASLLKALAASIILVYMILVVLYESYLTPVIRMLSLPCGLIGALLLMAISGKAINIMSLIGIIMLDGLASKNGTLLIDYTNTLMKRGLPLKEALKEAGRTRIRPIFMTSVTMIFGMLPTALSLGDGSELKSGMAMVLIGGLVASTLLTPILLPVAYTLIDDIRVKTASKRASRENELNI